jgi:hypothetical protein
MGMFNKILEGKIYCKAWKMATVCPIYKNKEQVGQPKNYRGDSLLSLSRGEEFFPSILAARVSGWLVNNKTLSRFHAGFLNI